MRVFVDSDVVISSLISNKGAAFALLNNPDVIKLISNYSVLEIEEVIKRLKINPARFKKLKTSLTMTQLEMPLSDVKSKFHDYVLDTDDAHIIAGSKKARFLITYNLRHFNISKIKQDFGIIVLTPGMFLQYLRSIS